MPHNPSTQTQIALGTRQLPNLPREEIFPLKKAGFDQLHQEGHHKTREKEKRRINTTVSQEKGQQTRENSPSWCKASRTFRNISRFSRSLRTSHQPPTNLSSLKTSHQTLMNQAEAIQGMICYTNPSLECNKLSADS